MSMVCSPCDVVYNLTTFVYTNFRLSFQLRTWKYKLLHPNKSEFLASLQKRPGVVTSSQYGLAYGSMKKWNLWTRRWLKSYMQNKSFAYVKTNSAALLLQDLTAHRHSEWTPVSWPIVGSSSGTKPGVTAARWESGLMQTTPMALKPGVTAEQHDEHEPPNPLWALPHPV